MVDYSKLSDADLMALSNNDYASISDNGLKMLANETQPVKENNGNFFSNFGKGLIQGVSDVGVGIGKNVVNKRLRPALGMEPLTDEQLDKAYGFLDDKPIGVGGNVGKFTGSFAPYLLVPEANIVKAGAAAPFINRTATGVLQGGITGGFEAAKEGDNPLKGIAIGGVGGAALSNVLPYTHYASKIVDNPLVKNVSSKVSELLTSVPSEYFQRALDKEFAGQSIFKRKFNSKDLNRAYKEAGQRAIEGMKNAEYEANTQIANALDNLSEGSINKPQLMIDISKDIDSYAHGGRYNPALKEKGDDILEFLTELDNKTNKTVDFHNIKTTIQEKVRNKYGKDSDKGVDALKGMAAKVREALNNISPEYAQANANREALHDIRFALDNMNPKTIASSLRNAESDAKLRGLYNEAAENLDNLVSPEYKFMDEVKDLRAREALESWYPGQYGGSGTPQGFGNLLRATILGGSPITALATHNPLALLSLATVSPKIAAKGTIQNLGRVYRTLNRQIPESVRRLLVPLSVKATAPMLYGGVSNVEEY